jgi:hypothetical protein
MSRLNIDYSKQPKSDIFKQRGIDDGDEGDIDSSCNEFLRFLQQTGKTKQT